MRIAKAAAAGALASCLLLAGSTAKARDFPLKLISGDMRLTTASVWQGSWLAYATAIILIVLIYSIFRLWSRTRRKHGDRTNDRSMVELVGNMPMLVMGVDEHGNIMLWNDECERVSGYSRGEVVGNPDALKMLFPDPDYRQYVLSMSDELRGNFRNWEVHWCCRNGKQKIISWSSIAKKFPIPGFTSWAVGVDVTGHRRDEQKLRESENSLRASHEIASLGSYRFGWPAGAVEWGDQTYDIIGWKRYEDPPSLEQYIKLVHPEDRDKIGVHIEESVRSMSSFECNYRLVTPAGELRYIHSIARPEAKKGGGIEIVGTIQDITALMNTRRQLEEERIKASKLESLGVLAGGIAHEFNNVLTGVMGNISLARSLGQLDRQAAVLLEKAEEAANRARELTERLLVFSRGGSPRKEPADIREIIRRAVEQVMEEADVEVTFDFEPGLELVEVDYRQLLRAITNIADNARLAMPDGGTFAVSAGETEIGPENPYHLSPGEYVFIRLQDSGGGIAEDIRSSIFDPYFTTRDFASGLGLTTAYFILTRHGGTVELEKNTGSGAAFRILLPIAIEPPSVASPPGRERDTERVARVLLMDDEQSVRDVAGLMLEHLGYRVEAVTDGERAVQAYREAMQAGDRFDLVILDISVPGRMGGVEAVKRLRLLDPAVKAIVSSGYGENPVMSSPADYGFQGVMPKPYRLEDVKNLLAELLSR